MSDDDDDVFESEDKGTEPRPQPRPVFNEPAYYPPPSSTGYRDYKPPPEVLEQSNFATSRNADSLWSSYKRDENPEQRVHKTILLGDSGVGKTSLLVQFDTGKFQHRHFAATVGIGFTETKTSSIHYILVWND